MDFTKLPRQLIYRDRKSLEEFTNNNEKNTELVNRMLDISILQTPDFKERVLDCFNAAYYICTLIRVDEHPDWSLPQYNQIALFKNFTYQGLTQSLVRLYIITFEKEWHEKHSSLSKRLDTIMASNWLSDDYGSFTCKELFDDLNTFDVATSSFPSNEFALRKIDQETIDDVHNIPFSWSELTEGYKTKSMEEIVFQVGKDESEMQLLLESFNRDAEKTYGKYDLRYESVVNRTGEIARDVFSYYHADDIINAEEYDDVGDEKPVVLNANNSQQNDASVEVERMNKETAKEQGTKQPEPSNSEIAQLHARIKELQDALNEEKSKTSRLEEEIEELLGPPENLIASQNVRLEFALQLLRAAGMDDKMLDPKTRKKATVARLLMLLTDIRSNNKRNIQEHSCSKYLSDRNYLTEDNKELIIKINTICVELGVNANLNI